jgi:putative spermidine/putrescine transport system permease protein
MLVTPALIFTVVCFLLPVAALLLDAFRIGGRQPGRRPAAMEPGPLRRFLCRAPAPAGSVAHPAHRRLVTLCSALLCYPAAQAIVRVAPRWRGLVLGMMILPLMVSPIARTYAWIVLFGMAQSTRCCCNWAGR